MCQQDLADGGAVHRHAAAGAGRAARLAVPADLRDVDDLGPLAHAEVDRLVGAFLEVLEEGHRHLEQGPVRAAVAWAAPALEIVDSGVAGRDISFADAVADNASSGLYVIGAPQVDLATIDPVAVEMAMTLNGVEVSVGRGSALLGDPLVALAWLARTARDSGEPLREGQVVLSGALGPMVAVTFGDKELTP
ncbi:hypothetical protein QI633_04055 [Nocardioides sp. QY071]|uniref:fumarylacetoacetate hydrolase family protein n=1 Tax=Nocardioides sp. QY071 TaxID=3044187 RepID=UPI00249CD67F|nr:fumarylacetoacetate hydrolase family protein [Nocardioides sp. QY071]WGY02933.1 hypothetical protein QI633_04055 [Nocardioides sp. QY071]